MSFYKIINFCLFFLLGCNLIFSQHYPVKNYTSASELPNNSVRSLLMDSKKVLWIGTENGVVKKENDVLQYYFEEDGLALNSCWAIAEDENANIWFGSYGGGLSVYDGFGFKVIAEEDGLVHNEVIKLFSYGRKMYVGTSHGLSVIDIHTFKVQSFKPLENNPLFRVVGFFEYAGEIYTTTYSTGIYKISETEEAISLKKLNNHHFIYSVFRDNDSIYSSNKGFYTKTSVEEYLKPKDALSAQQFGESIIWEHIQTGDNRRFVAAWGIYDTNGGIYELQGNHMISRNQDFNVSSREVQSLVYDPNFEKLYAGTLDAGLFEISLNPQIKFTAAPGKNILGFANTGNSEAVLFNDGLEITSNRLKTTITLTHLKNWQENHIFGTQIPLPKHEDDFYELDHSTGAEEIGFYDIKASEEHYWVNTNIGIFAIKDSGELYKYLPVHSEEISFTPGGKLIETNPYGGVRIYHDLDAFKYIYFDQFAPHTPTMVVNSLQLGNRTYFLSIFSGLYKFENGRFSSYLEKGIWQEKKLKHITKFDDKLAVSNEFGDIFIFEDQPEFRLLSKIPRGTFEGNTISFLKSYCGSLVVGTERGLTLINGDRFIFIDKEQGLEQPFLSAKVDKNMLSIGSTNGIHEIDLDALSSTPALVDQISLKEIFVNNQKFSSGQSHASPHLELAHHQNSVLLKFSTNAHPYPKKLKFQYRLQKNEEWSLPDAKPEIFLAALPAQDYDLEVRVLDQSTGFSYTQPLLKMSILPPFYKTWWFILLITALLLVSSYIIYSIQLQQNRKFEEQKSLIQKRFEETKMEALLSQMNPHFIFNAMNSIQYYIVENEVNKASAFLGDFAKLIRLNLDHCTKPTILLSEEIEYLTSYVRVENTRFNNKIEVKIEVDPGIDIYDVEIPTMILQTFVENVFVHAFPENIKDPTLKISFEMADKNLLQCRIKDNGIGYFKKSKMKLHQSKGVSLVKERLALLGYNVEEAVQVISVKNKGTSIILNLEV